MQFVVPAARLFSEGAVCPLCVAPSSSHIGMLDVEEGKQEQATERERRGRQTDRSEKTLSVTTPFALQLK